MSALAEALVAAQRRALTATQKAYVAGVLERSDAVAELNTYGLTDDVDIGYLLSACDVIRARGAGLPSEPTPAANGEPASKKPEPASQPQLDLIQRLIGEKGAQHPDLPLTKAEAHEVIDTLKAGTYDYAKWALPF